MRNKVKGLSKDASASTTVEDEKETLAVLSFGRMASFESIEDLENQVRITPDFKLVRIDGDKTQEEQEEEQTLQETTIHPNNKRQGAGPRTANIQGNEKDEVYHLERDCSETVKSTSTAQSSCLLILPPDMQLSDDLPHPSMPAKTKERCHTTTSSTDQSEMTAMDKEGSSMRLGQHEMGASTRGLSRQGYIIASLMISVVLALVILFVTLSGNNGDPTSSGSSEVLTPSLRQHTSAPTEAATTSDTTDQVTLIPTTTFAPMTNIAEQEEVINGEMIEEATLEARVETSSSTMAHAAVRAEAVKKQRLRTEALWGNVAHQVRAPTGQTSSSNASKTPYSKKSVQ
jgi:hypothetical protein